MVNVNPKGAIAGILSLIAVSMPLATTAHAESASFDEILYGRPCGAAVSNYPDTDGITQIIILAMSAGFLAANMEEDTVREYVLDDPLALADIWATCQNSENTLLEILTAARWNLPSDRL